MRLNDNTIGLLNDNQTKHQKFVLALRHLVLIAYKIDYDRHVDVLAQLDHKCTIV